MLGLVTTWALLAAAAWVSGACGDGIQGPDSTLARDSVLRSATVSNPVAAAASRVPYQAPSLAPPPGTTIAYVSLPPGALPDGQLATLHNRATGSSTTTIIMNGGFDPVPVAASASDTVNLDIKVSGGQASLHFIVMVPAARRPIVVRTDPPPHKRDVPMNASLVIVFSEPVDPATITAQSVLLLQAGQPVSGRPVLASDRLRVEFQPDQALLPGTAYALVATTDVADPTGDRLEQAVSVDFTTGTTEPAAGLVFATVSAGENHTCGVTTGGAAYCWGDNYYGQLGTGTTASSSTPVLVAGGLTFQAVSAGGRMTCGVTVSGAAYCWGGNASGELGNGTVNSSATPVPVAGGHIFSMVSATGGFGDDFACGLTTTGAALCWGANMVGAHGDGSMGGVSPWPVAVLGGLTFAAISAGGAHTCGVTTTGAGYCWGNNIDGQVGDSTFTNRATPVAVLGGLTLAVVSARNQSTCGITTTGAAYCWGWLGLIATTPGPQQCWDAFDEVFQACGPTPATLAGGLTLSALSLGFPTSCGVTTTGAAYCWGDNSAGELGDGTTTTSGGTPVAVAGGLTFAVISAGNNGFACGVTTNRLAYCWGRNDHGQLGTGTTTDGAVPVRVAGQP